MAYRPIAQLDLIFIFAEQRLLIQVDVAAHRLLSMLPPFSDPEKSSSARFASEASKAWELLAHRLAGRPRMRLAKDRDWKFPARHERPLTHALPVQPAAVMVYALDGTCKMLVLDMDFGRNGGDMEAQSLAIMEDLKSTGLRFISDYSPSGGRHFYIPLSTAVPQTRARNLVEAIALRHNTLDPGPHRSVASGCIRVPGSAHKSGGHQRLTMPVETALSILENANSTTDLQRLESAYAPELGTNRRFESTVATPVLGQEDLEPGAGGRMSLNALEIARTAQWHPNSYASPSEARMAVIASAVRAGLDHAAITLRMNNGTWPGLRELYGKYRASAASRALSREILKAQQLPRIQGKNTVHRINTSQPQTQGGQPKTQTEYRYLRILRSAVHLLDMRYNQSRGDFQKRLVLRALVEAGVKTGTRFVEFGSRALGLATGLDHTTVSRHLNDLRNDPDPMIVLVRKAQGRVADLYQLQLPADLAASAQAVSYRAGKIHALRPVFRVLGHPAAFVLERLEQGDATAAEISEQTGLSRSMVHEALQTLQSWKLVEPSSFGWSRAYGVSLQLLAETLGATEQVAQQRAAYAEQRVIWHQWLNSRFSPAVTLATEDDEYPFELFDPGPDPMYEEMRT